MMQKIDGELMEHVRTLISSISVSLCESFSLFKMFFFRLKNYDFLSKFNNTICIYKWH